MTTTALRNRPVSKADPGTMTYRTDSDYDDEEGKEAVAPGTWAAAAAAVSVLIIATITLTVVASGWDMSAALPFG